MIIQGGKYGFAKPALAQRNFQGKIVFAKKQNQDQELRQEYKNMEQQLTPQQQEQLRQLDQNYRFYQQVPTYPIRPQVQQTASPGFPFWIWLILGFGLAKLWDVVSKYINMFKMFSGMGGPQPPGGGAPNDMFKQMMNSQMGQNPQNPFGGGFPGGFPGGQNPFGGGFPQQPPQQQQQQTPSQQSQQYQNPPINTSYKPVEPQQQYQQPKSNSFQQQQNEQPGQQPGQQAQSKESGQPQNGSSSFKGERFGQRRSSEKKQPAQETQSSMFTDVGPEEASTSSSNGTGSQQQQFGQQQFPRDYNPNFQNQNAYNPDPQQQYGQYQQQQQGQKGNNSEMVKMYLNMIKNNPQMKQMMLNSMPEGMRNEASIDMMMDNPMALQYMEQYMMDNPTIRNYLDSMQGGGFNNLGNQQMPNFDVQKMMEDPALMGLIQKPNVQKWLVTAQSNLPQAMSEGQNDPDIQVFMQKMLALQQSQ